MKMAEHNAYEKIHNDESQKSNFEGLLEQLNLPPKVVTFYRENKTLVKVVSASVIVLVCGLVVSTTHTLKPGWKRPRHLFLRQWHWKEMSALKLLQELRINLVQHLQACGRK